MEVAPNEVAECRVHRNDGSAAQKNVVIRIDGRARSGLERAVIPSARRTLCRAEAPNERRSSRNHRAEFQKSAPGNRSHEAPLVRASVDGFIGRSLYGPERELCQFSFSQSGSRRDASTSICAKVPAMLVARAVADRQSRSDALTACAASVGADLDHGL
jgi:hypothetical protein